MLSERPVPRRALVGCAAALSLALSSVGLAACTDKAADPAASGSASASAPATSAGPPVSGSPSPSASAKATVATSLNAIKVVGRFGQKPKVTVPSPWKIDKTRSTALSTGKGRVVRGGDAIVVNYVGVNGSTGSMFNSSFEQGDTVLFPLSNVVPGFKKGLVGQRVGSRVLIAIEGKDGYDPYGGNQDQTVKLGDTMIFVVDIVDASLTSATGSAVTPKASLPTVTFTRGKPAVKIPTGKPPTDNVVAPLVAGKGRKVGATDQIVIHYAWWSWKTGKTIENVYDKAEAVTLDQLIPGWTKGLKGQRVGSRILIVTPPALAYPDGNKSPAVDKGDTIVGVIDILYAKPAAG